MKKLITALILTLTVAVAPAANADVAWYRFSATVDFRINNFTDRTVNYTAVTYNSRRTRTVKTVDYLLNCDTLVITFKVLPSRVVQKTHVVRGTLSDLIFIRYCNGSGEPVDQVSPPQPVTTAAPRAVVLPDPCVIMAATPEFQTLVATSKARITIEPVKQTSTLRTCESTPVDLAVSIVGSKSYIYEDRRPQSDYLPVGDGSFFYKNSSEMLMFQEKNGVRVFMHMTAFTADLETPEEVEAAKRMFAGFVARV